MSATMHGHGLRGARPRRSPAVRLLAAGAGDGVGRVSATGCGLCGVRPRRSSAERPLVAGAGYGYGLCRVRARQSAAGWRTGAGVSQEVVGW